MKKATAVPCLVLVAAVLAAPISSAAQALPRPGPVPPNIVLMFADNVGMGEVSAYGSARGVRTPNIDRLAAEGIKLTNFNVEYSCIPSRIALLTGRYSVRTGDSLSGGMTLWEVTVAEALRTRGYATALFGKWDVGGVDWQNRREPTHQGFDEWWGIPGTSDVAQFASFEGFDPARTPAPYIWEGRAGEPSRKATPYTPDTRRTIDREAAARGIAFMEKNVKLGKPFFLYFPITQIHFPALPHPDFAGATGAGDVGDAMVDMDHTVGLVLEAIARLGIEENTLVIWTADNGAEMRRPWRGAAGPWRGFYNSAMEGGIRTPCVIRWPGRIGRGQVSGEVIHEVDLLPTIAAAAGAPEIVPRDRAIDGRDQLPLLQGTQVRSARDSVLFTAREGQVMAVKWRDWKFWYLFRTEMPDPDPANLIRLFDLRADPREETDVKDFYPWVISVADGMVAEFEASLREHPRVPGGIDDPYVPPPRGSGPPVAVYSRTDRNAPGPRGDALPNPDFSGTWSTASASSAPPPLVAAPATVPALGSGWGDRISIVHKGNRLDIERVFFVPRELQPVMRYRYALDGSETANAQQLGRSGPPPTARTAWDGNRLVITTLYPFQDPADGRWRAQTVTQTMWLQPSAASPFEPSLVVETTRGSALGGPPSTNRTVYSKGYR